MSSRLSSGQRGQRNQFFRFCKATAKQAGKKAQAEREKLAALNAMAATVNPENTASNDTEKTEVRK